MSLLMRSDTWAKAGEAGVRTHPAVHIDDFEEVRSDPSPLSEPDLALGGFW